MFCQVGGYVIVPWRVLTWSWIVCPWKYMDSPKERSLPTIYAYIIIYSFIYLYIHRGYIYVYIYIHSSTIWIIYQSYKIIFSFIPIILFFQHSNPMWSSLNVNRLPGPQLPGHGRSLRGLWRGASVGGAPWQQLFIKSLTRWWFQRLFIFTPNPGEMIQFDEHIFQMGWNHQLADYCLYIVEF